MERQIIEAIRGELGRRMGRAEGENLLQYLEEPLGGEDGAADLWHDIAQEVLKLRPPALAWWQRALGWVLRKRE